MEARAHRAGQPNLARPLGSHLPVSIRTLATSKTVMLGQRPEHPGRTLRHLPWTLGSVAEGAECSNCPTLATFETVMLGQRPEQPARRPWVTNEGIAQPPHHLKSSCSGTRTSDRAGKRVSVRVR